MADESLSDLGETLTAAMSDGIIGTEVAFDELMVNVRPEHLWLL